MICEVCKTEFEPRKTNQKGCGSAKCRKERYRRAHAKAEHQEAPRVLVPEINNAVDAAGRVGPPIKLTASVQKTICEMVRAGNYLKIACAAAGISADSLSRWRKKGAAGEEPYAAFLRELEHAELDCESALVKKWHDAAPDDWRAARDLLARRFPDRWGRQVEEESPGRLPSAGLNIIIDLSGGSWEPTRREIPAVSEGDAKAIESASPATRV
jgi:hypothetical protein